MKSSGITQSIFLGIHPIEGKFGLMTSVPFGGNSLKWFRDFLRPGMSFEQLNEEASEVEAGSEGLLFVPISISSSGRGAFLWIDGIHKASHFTRAVFEGVSFINKKHLDLIQEAGVKVKKLIMIGGGAKSYVSPQIVAHTCNIAVSIQDMKEAACAGAAILAGVGSTVFPSIEKAVDEFVRNVSSVHPKGVNRGVYEKAFQDYLTLLEHV